jgi:signal transduction histidine kinase
VSLPGRPNGESPSAERPRDAASAPRESAPLPDTGADELDERRLQVITEQAVGLRWQILLTATIVVLIVWTAAPPAAVLVWYAAVLVVREVRARALVRLVADRATPIAVRLAATVRWNLLLGASNGAAALFMAYTDTTLDAVLTMILVSWGAGAVSTSSTVMRAFIAYASLMFVPIALMWLLAGPWLGWGVAALVLMFFGVQTRFARRNLETFEQSFSIRRENEALARSLAAERTELARARDAAEQANRDKSRFLAAASHDLRQPLQALTLNSGELARLPLAGEARTIAAEIGTSVEHLRSLLDTLLDLSKIDAGAIVAQPRRVRLDVLVDGVLGSFHAAAAARGLHLRGDCPAGVAVVADPDLLRRMLANLVDNAIKFTARGGVDVHVAAGERDATIEVRDTGAGIAAEHHALIFEDLVRLPRAGERPAGGHGLGLGIVRRAAELMGAKIEIESSPGQGATFRWRLPLAAGDDAATVERAPGWSLAGRRVVVLDDDAMVRGAYANALAAAGALARVAATIDEAVSLAGDADVALVDWRLGEQGDGFTAIRRLREPRPGLPVVMVTADTGQAIADAAVAHGVALLRKPVDAAALGRTLGQAIAESPLPQA